MSLVTKLILDFSQVYDFFCSFDPCCECKSKSKMTKYQACSSYTSPMQFYFICEQLKPLKVEKYSMQSSLNFHGNALQLPIQRCTLLRRVPLYITCSQKLAKRISTPNTTYVCLSKNHKIPGGIFFASETDFGRQDPLTNVNPCTFYGYFF